MTCRRGPRPARSGGPGRRAPRDAGAGWPPGEDVAVEAHLPVVLTHDRKVTGALPGEASGALAQNLAVRPVDLDGDRRAGGLRKARHPVAVPRADLDNVEAREALGEPRVNVLRRSDGARVARADELRAVDAEGRDCQHSKHRCAVTRQ
eukprot:scaffold52525_cov75-Phaeocystis_antarctica.AAC.5